MILVTGGTGNIGRDVVKGLSAAGAKVRALVRDPAKAKDLALPGVELFKGDVADKASLEKAFAGVDKAFLLTNGDPGQVELQSGFIQAAKKANVKLLVKLSALGADPKADVNLGKWHGQTEAELKQSGVPYVILQPAFFMQNFMMFADSIKKQGTFYGTMGEAKFSPVDTRDIAAVAVRSLLDEGHAGKTYVITGPETLSMSQAAAKLAQATGNKISYTKVPAEGLKQGMVQGGVPNWLADDMLKMYAFFDTGNAAFISDVAKTVGKSNPHTFDQFARDFAGAFKA